jgi:hypothetical protein
MKTFLNPLLSLVVMLSMSSFSYAQNKQITIKKEVDEHGNVISYDSTVIETSGNINPEQMEAFQQEMAEMSSQLKEQMADFKIEMKSSMESMQEEMSKLIPDDFNMDSFGELFNMDQMKSLMDEQMKMFDELFDSKESVQPKTDDSEKIIDEQMY